jgi:YVTN family beta-propeller protein
LAAVPLLPKYNLTHVSKYLPLLAFCLVATACQPGEDHWVANAPAGARLTAIDREGITVIPNGRLLTPLGTSVRVAPHPYGLEVSPDGNRAVTANSGTGPFAISIIDDLTGIAPSVRQLPAGPESDEGAKPTVFMGLAFSPDGSTLYGGGGQGGQILVFDATSGERRGSIDANVPMGGRQFEHSYIGDLALSADGSTLYAVDQTNFRLIIADVATRKVKASVPVGRYPFGVTLSPDGGSAFVANVGMYEYSMIEGVDADADSPRLGTTFPAAAFGSEQAHTGTEAEGYQIPGLGDPNAPESFSVWTVDVRRAGAEHVVSRIKTGYLVGEWVEEFPNIGGSSPNSLVATDRLVFVSNGNNDTVSVIDVAADSVVAEIKLELDPRLAGLRGHIPFGMALSPDGDRLYVAEAGINAVAVVDTRSFTVLGHLPVGWFPSKVAVTPDGENLIVANAKGWGSGPNGGPDFQEDERGAYVGGLMNGFVSIIPIPSDGDLPGHTSQVVKNNFSFERPRTASSPIPAYPGERVSPIEHIVFITKENRTYDEVFGQLTPARGEASLARFGANQDLERGGISLSGVDVMPNHLALAGQFGIGDNFYCDSDVSADGHRWLVGVYPNEWVETSVAAAYGGRRSMTLPTTAPGVLSFVGSSGAIYPEDYPEAGSIWDHMERGDVEFFNFGLGFEFAPGWEEQEFKYTGIRLPINYPMPAPLWERTSKKFATYNTSIPDQFRVDMFIEEFEERWADGGLPPVLTMMLPNDHGAGVRPDEGYPFFESFMADNDLALGRVIEYLSHTPYWEKMMIVVTEDDPQGGVDHVDAHRSVLMVVSPWAKRGHVAGLHYSFGSIMKTFWNVLGLPYLNQYDAGATDLADFFLTEPDFTPYTAIAPDRALFDPALALDPMDADFNWEALSESPEMDDVETMQAWAETGFEARQEE